MALKPAAAPVSVSYSKYQNFSGTLLVVVPHDGNVLSQFPKDDGSPQYQTYATIIPVEDGVFRQDDGKKVEWKAGDVHKAFINGAKVRRQLLEMNEPVVGRLVKGKPVAKGGRPWELATPTDEEMAQVNAIDGIEELVAEAVQAAAERAANAAPPAPSEEDEDVPQGTPEGEAKSTAPWKK